MPSPALSAVCFPVADQGPRVTSKGSLTSRRVGPEGGFGDPETMLCNGSYGRLFAECPHRQRTLEARLALLMQRALGVVTGEAQRSCVGDAG